MSPRKPRLDIQDLRRFTGDAVRYRHGLNPGVIYTPGVRYLAEQGEAFWLIDAIASYFGSSKMRAAIKKDERLASMQFWRLRKFDDERATLICQADAGEPAAILQAIPWTDFPLSEIEVWAGYDGEHWTLYLPSEH